MNAQGQDRLERSIEAVPNACITSGIESKAGCAGVGFESPFACSTVPLTAGRPLSSAVMVLVVLSGAQCLFLCFVPPLKDAVCTLSYDAAPY
jgi:hypothetical protein